MTLYQQQLDEFMRRLGFEYTDNIDNRLKSNHKIWYSKSGDGLFYFDNEAAFMYNLTLEARKDEATRNYNSAKRLLERSRKWQLTKEKIEIIRNVQATLRADVQDMDPGMRQLVSKNFKSLLWN